MVSTTPIYLWTLNFFCLPISLVYCVSRQCKQDQNPYILCILFSPTWTSRLGKLVFKTNKQMTCLENKKCSIMFPNNKFYKSPFTTNTHYSCWLSTDKIMTYTSAIHNMIVNQPQTTLFLTLQAPSSPFPTQTWELRMRFQPQRAAHAWFLRILTSSSCRTDCSS